MTDRLDELLRALPEPVLDRRLDQLEPRVWARIEAARAAPAMFGSVRFQLVTAGLALCVGLALGWSMSARYTGEEELAAVDYASYVEAGPMARLGEGL